MPETTLRVSVIYAEEEPEDRRLAEELKRELAELVVVQMLGIDEVAAFLQRSRYERAMLIAVPVFILSEASTADGLRRRAVVAANPVLGHLDFRSYYICRGVTPLQLLERHVELGRLADEAMIVGQDAKASLLADLREYTRSKPAAPPSYRSLLKVIAVSGRFLAAALASLLGSLGALFFFLGFPAGIVLAVLQVRGKPSLIASLLVLTCLCAGGTALHMVVESLEVWPWLGPRWKLARGERDRDGKGSTFSLSELDAALSLFRRARRWAAGFGGVVLGVLLGPSLFAAFTKSAPAVTWMLAAAAFGLGSPLLKTWAYRVFAHFEAGQRGLLDENLARFDSLVARLDVKPMPHSLAALGSDVLDLFDEDDLAQIRRWINVAALGLNSAVHRPWLRPRDTVFISHVWADDPQTGVAEKLSGTLDRLGIRNFLDKRHITSGFVGWRSHVAFELSRATHVLLVVSPSIVRGKVIAQEIRAIMQRWYFELLPSVICVVEPAVAATLTGDGTVPLELRFLLAWCPNITFAEAQDGEALGHLIRQRRRNGRIRDWWVLLSGPLGERSMVAELTR